MPLELKENRVLPITIGKRTYLYIVRPIATKEWLEYFAGVSVEQENKGGEIINTIETTGARLHLLRSVLVDAQGYATPENKSLAEIEGWFDLLPIAHRAAAADLLFEVGEDLASDLPAVLGAETIALRAMWSRPEGVDAIAEFGGLVHTFRVPSADQQRRYSRDASRSTIIGGRKGKTRFLGAQPTLLALYDELIVSVTGYTANGEPLNDRKDLIVQSMDGFHKTQAMGAVFSPSQEA